MQSLETRIQLGSSDNAGKGRCFLIAVDISGQLTERECKILGNTARRCEIGKMLNGNVDIQYQINFHP